AQPVFVEGVEDSAGAGVQLFEQAGIESVRGVPGCLGLGLILSLKCRRGTERDVDGEWADLEEERLVTMRGDELRGPLRQVFRGPPRLPARGNLARAWDQMPVELERFVVAAAGRAGGTEVPLAEVAGGVAGRVQ